MNDMYEYLNELVKKGERQRRIARRFFSSVAVAEYILYIVWSLVVRFQNVEMTETQLLISFWYVWLIILFGCIKNIFIIKEVLKW